MVAQVLANLSPAMIPDYAQAPAVYVETDGSKPAIIQFLNRLHYPVWNPYNMLTYLISILNT